MCICNLLISLLINIVISSIIFKISLYSLTIENRAFSLNSHPLSSSFCVCVWWDSEQEGYKSDPRSSRTSVTRLFGSSLSYSFPLWLIFLLRIILLWFVRPVRRFIRRTLQDRAWRLRSLRVLASSPSSLFGNGRWERN